MSEPISLRQPAPPRTPALPWKFLRRYFGPGPAGPRGFLLARWLFLRLLAVWCFSAFYSLVFQIKGLIGPDGILPAGPYLHSLAPVLFGARFWFAPTLLWLSAGNGMLLGLCWTGMAAAVLLFLNLWPRGMLAVSLACYLSFCAAAQDFSGYQSDGMLLEAIFLSVFFAPRGLRPGLGYGQPPSRASLWLLRWEWFRIYFESGMAKLLSGDPEWRHLTAMQQYYQNGPLPTWLGWYAEQAPHWFATASAAGTLIMELGVVLLVFLPRRFRLVCFFIVTPWEMGVILTANYTFLNYLVLSLGVLLLDDAQWQWLAARLRLRRAAGLVQTVEQESAGAGLPPATRIQRGRTVIAAAALLAVFYATTIEMAAMALPVPGVLLEPARLLAPFRIANQYGLFAVMTRGRYEIEFQGSNDGVHWTPYSFRYKPQALNKPPGIYAPYQPRMDWNLWFASLGDWQQNQIVLNIEARLLQGSPRVLKLFAGDPFAGHPPLYVRAVLWQYWFTTQAEKRETGDWWRRSYMGVYAPVLKRQAGGALAVVANADPLPEHD